MRIHGVTDKKFPVVRFLILNVLVSIVLMVIFMRGAFHSWTSVASTFLWTFSICTTQWLGLEFVYSMVDRRISWIEAPVKKTIAQIVSFLIYSASAFILVQFVNFYVWRNIAPQLSWPFIVDSLPSTLIISLFLSLIFTASGFLRAWKQSFLQAEKLKVEMLAYKYESLRNQINPHFLFNSLNVLSDLVYDDQTLAVKFIRQLSDLFRYVLDSRDKELVPLSEELDFMRSYLFLLKTRFEEKLIVGLNIQAEADDFIVPMTLQLLVENAVKHNEVSEAFPLRISIRKNGDYIEVENILKPKQVGEDSKKTGLKNIIQQFAFFSDQPVEILPSETKFLVRVPILKSQEK